MKLDAPRFALALGIVWAFGVVMLACMARLFGWGGAVVGVIASVYIGYSPTWAGLFIGAIWGFVDGFVGGFLLGWLYNRLLPAKVE